MASDERTMYIVEVEDPAHNPLSRPLHFRLGPFASLPEAEQMARRARATEAGAQTRIVTVEG